MVPGPWRIKLRSHCARKWDRGLSWFSSTITLRKFVFTHIKFGREFDIHFTQNAAEQPIRKKVSTWRHDNGKQHHRGETGIVKDYRSTWGSSFAWTFKKGMQERNREFSYGPCNQVNEIHKAVCSHHLQVMSFSMISSDGKLCLEQSKNLWRLSFRGHERVCEPFITELVIGHEIS